jgi:hypothetical protein
MTYDDLLLSRDAIQPAGPQTVTGSERLRSCQVLDSKGPDRNGTHGTQIFTDFWPLPAGPAATSVFICVHLWLESLVAMSSERLVGLRRRQARR